MALRKVVPQILLSFTNFAQESAPSMAVDAVGSIPSRCPLRVSGR